MKASESVAPPCGRVTSIDALRGFDMFWIVGGQQAVLALIGLFVLPIPDWLGAQLNHGPWEGFTAWDLIMPLFLFIVGTAMPFSFARRIEEGQGKAALYRKILTRVAILFVLGMAAQGNLLDANLETLQIYCNTLQAIAVGYLISSVALLHLRIPLQIVLLVTLLVGYWLLMLLVPVPGYGAGVLEVQSNLAKYVDKLVLGRFFFEPDPCTWVLSSMAFGANVLLGVFSGHLLRTDVSPWKKLGWLVLVGMACIAVGWGWSSDWMGAMRFPIIKPLYTSSMVLWACGWSYLLLALFYLVIDMLGFRRWAFPLIVIGSNAILAYMGVHLIDFQQIGNVFVGGVAKNCAESESGFLQALGATLGPIAAFGIVWLILGYLYRKGTFVRV